MGFSDKMNASLGAEGARIEVSPPAQALARGAGATTTVTIVGGTRPATVEGLVVRLVEAIRHFEDTSGRRLTEGEAAAAPDRTALRPGWTRTTVSERRIGVQATVDAGQGHEIAIEFEVPATCGATAPERTHTLHVQADIRGQIDPTGTARVSLV